MDDLEKAWEQALACARAQIIPSSTKKPFGHVRLKLHPERQVWRQGMPRSLALIPDDVRAALRGAILGERRWPLFFQGTAGTGKTCAALCLLDHAGGWYWTMRGLHRDLVEGAKEKVAYPFEGEPTRLLTARGIWQVIEKCNLVVLDELGTRADVSEPQFENLIDVLEARAGKPLLCVSNFSFKQLVKIYDERVVSRLCSGTIVAFAGRDRRLGG